MPTQERVIIHNVETDSEEDDEPISVVEKKRTVEKKWKRTIGGACYSSIKKTSEFTEDPTIQVQPIEIHVQVMGEGGLDEEHVEHDEQDERMVLTLEAQEKFLQQLGGNEQGHETEIERPFEEEVSKNLEEIARQ